MENVQTKQALAHGWKEFVDARLHRGSKTDILSVLERAAEDPGFIAQLTYRGSEALKDFHLTAREQAALLSGDIKWIEAQVGKLDEHLKTWLRCRLGQEIW
jgi:hypothetical protein